MPPTVLDTTPWATDRQWGLLIVDCVGVPVAVGLTPEIAASIVAVVNERFRECREERHA